MTGIVEFLAARLDDDTASLGEPDPDFEDWALNRSPDGNEGALVWYDRRLRADIAAKRAIIAAEMGPDIEGDAADLHRRVLCILASVYADHEDYQQEWEQ